MAKSRGVSGFWLDINALENARTTLIAQLGQNEGMKAWGAWVRIFTWQYGTAQPIKGPEHVARITGYQLRTAKSLWQCLHQCLPQSLVQRSGQTYCKRTIQTLEKFEKKQQRAGATSYHDQGGDSYSSLTSSLPSQESRSGDPLEGRSVKSHSRKNANTTTAGYPSDFERLWESRARRAGGDDKKRAVRAWSARLKEGHAAEAIQAGMERYRAFCRAQDKEGTQYVMQTATFLGPSDPPHFVESWDIPLATGAKTKLSATEQLRAAGWFDDGMTIEGEYEKH